MFSSLKYPVLLCVVFLLSGCQTMGSASKQAQTDLQNAANQARKNCWVELKAMPEFFTYDKYLPTTTLDPQRVQKMTNPSPVPAELIESVLKILSKDDECVNLELAYVSYISNDFVEVIIDAHSFKTASAVKLVQGKYVTVGEFAKARYDNGLKLELRIDKINREIRDANAADAAANKAARSRAVSEAINSYQQQQNQIFNSLLNMTRRTSCTSSFLGNTLYTNCY